MHANALHVSHVEIERLEAGEHRVRRWDGGDLGWTGLHVASRDANIQRGKQELASMQFTPNGLDDLGPYLEFRFEAAIGGVSIGEASQLYRTEGSMLKPAG